jgi:hypothetical protein
MSPTALDAWNTAEIRLFFLVTPCRACGKGPLTQKPPAELAAKRAAVGVISQCAACGDQTDYTFIVHDPNEPATGMSHSLRQTQDPSRIIDVADWLTLSQMLQQTAAGATDRAEARRLRIEAGQCLDEALKFFTDENNDLPPAEAFFSRASRERLRRSPQLFSRQRLLNLRGSLPMAGPLRGGADRSQRERHDGD